LKNEVYTGYLNKLKNKIYGLLCEQEKNGEWEKFLDSIICELIGFDESQKTINYYILLSKLSSLRFLRYEYFRKTIFECIGLIDKI
jgi:hypothetical protein